MRRRANRKKSAAAMSLFPFLAVLICTMGSLVMLLVLLMQQAHAQAVAENRERTAALSDEQQQQVEQMRLQAEDESWRAEVLEQRREQIQQQVAERRLQLAHLEQHIRDLEQQWKTLQIQAAEITQLLGSESADLQPLEQQKQQLQRDLEKSRAALEKARQSVAERPRAYAIIPYPGPNGTKRRPIYIECTERGVVLQPENIVLTADDFAEPLGPGNPLDAALRTIHAHHKRAFGFESSQSYPLIIVRPNGVASYAAARAAMSGWEDEFGYELVDEDLVLNFPPPDPGLSVELQKAIEVARQRQQLRREAMPSMRGAGGFVVSQRHGGLVRLGGEEASIGSDSGGARSGSGASGSAADAAAERSMTTGNGSAAGATAANGTSNNNQSGGGSPGGMAPAGRAAGATGPSMGGAASLAGTRGADWALQKKTANSTGYRRPVRVVCREDALILIPEAISNDRPQVFPFDQDTTQTIDQFVQALNKRVELWGLPPLNGYWRPQLVIQVETNAAARFEALEQLLHNSGLEIKRELR